MKKELRHKGVTLQLLWFEYRELHPDGYGYSQFCQLYRDWRRRLDVVMRQDHKAGEKLFVDFPGSPSPSTTSVTLELSFEAELFVAVLGRVELLRRGAAQPALEHWVNAHVHAFEFYGGVPEIVVSDNLKQRRHQGASLRARPQRHLPGDGERTTAPRSSPRGPTSRATRPRSKSGVQIVERWIIAVLRHRALHESRRAQRGDRDTRRAPQP
jgi:transposase